MVRKILRFVHLFILPPAIIIAGWCTARRLARPELTVTPAQTERARSVRILRDEWGVPHIFGHTDADAAFGFAYAHAQDDWPLMQGSLLAARGSLARFVLSKTAIANDYYVRLFGIRELVDAHYNEIDPKAREVFEAYAQGANYYAALHPKEADSRFFPISGKDVVAGFVHKIPLFTGVDHIMGRILKDEPLRIGDPLDRAQEPDFEARPGRMQARSDGSDLDPMFGGTVLGSNAHALAPLKTQSGFSLLNVNSHQPWEGPVAWYEAQIHSDEGWNVTGGTFPGAPTILHGHNDNLGWAHTVNHPDIIDIYKLEMHPDGSLRYRFDGEWKDLVKTEARIPVDLGLLDFTYKREVLRSVHGPVLRSSHGFYALRVAGAERSVRAAEQWYKMNKAKNLAEWKEAMRLIAVPMFNTVYADRQNIYYVYNGALPVRNADYDWRTVLPGNTSKTLWTKYLTYDELPQMQNPPSGFLQNCNTTPFKTTLGAGNPPIARYPKSLGIDTRMNNRSLRSLELLGRPGRFSNEDFLRIKWDRTYTKDTPIWRHGLNRALNGFKPDSEDEKKAVKMIEAWDGSAEVNSTTAALAILTYREIWWEIEILRTGGKIDPHDAFRKAIRFLKKNYGRIDVPLGRVQRLRRGSVDLPMGGGPDVLSAVHSEEKGGHLVGTAGDSYVLLVEFPPAGARSWSVHQYGNVNRPDSPHYADQAALFVGRVLKPTLRLENEIRQRLESEYHPGQEKRK